MMRSLLRGSAIAALLAAGCTSNGPRLAEGAHAPALTAAAHDGTVVDLSNLAEPTVVYFYPKDGTPGCTKEACAFRDVWSRFEDAGVQVVGVSADSNASHAAFAAEHELPFPLIADEDGTWAKAFGVGTKLGMTDRESFLLATDGTVVKVYPGVDPGVHADEVLRDAQSLP